MPEMDGIELTEQIKSGHPDIKVAILTMHAKQDFVQRSRTAGADGFIMKHVEPMELIETLLHIARGGHSF